MKKSFLERMLDWLPRINWGWFKKKFGRSDAKSPPSPPVTKVVKVEETKEDAPEVEVATKDEEVTPVAFASKKEEDEEVDESTGIGKALLLFLIPILFVIRWIWVNEDLKAATTSIDLGWLKWVGLALIVALAVALLGWLTYFISKKTSWRPNVTLGMLLKLAIIIGVLIWGWNVKKWWDHEDLVAHTAPIISDMPDTGRVIVYATKFGSIKYLRPDGHDLNWEILNKGGCTVLVQYAPTENPSQVITQEIPKTYALTRLHSRPRWLQFFARDDCEAVKISLWVATRPVT